MTAWAGFWMGAGFALGCLFLSLALMELRAYFQLLIEQTVKNALPWMLVTMQQARELDALNAKQNAKPAPAKRSSKSEAQRKGEP